MMLKNSVVFFSPLHYYAPKFTWHPGQRQQQAKERKMLEKKTLSSFFKSFRFQLLFLVFIAMFPALAIIVYFGLERRHIDIENKPGSRPARAGTTAGAPL